MSRIDQLPKPARAPAGTTVLDGEGLFVVGVRGRTPAADRLADALGFIVETVPERSAVVAPNLFRSRWLLARGLISEAHRAFSRAIRQCRDAEEVATLRARYKPPRLTETALSTAMSP